MARPDFRYYVPFWDQKSNGRLVIFANSGSDTIFDFQFLGYD
jgi:hypothetical protein